MARTIAVKTKPAAAAKPAAAVTKAMPAKKAAPAAARKPAAKAVPTPAPKTRAKPAVKRVAAPVAVKESAPVQLNASAEAVREKSRKSKLVRDSFTMPEQEYALLGNVKKACLKAGFEIKKSELLRIGVSLVSKMEVSALQKVLEALPQLKTGRPKNP